MPPSVSIKTRQLQREVFRELLCTAKRSARLCPHGYWGSGPSVRMTTRPHIVQKKGFG
jgi:hypothetical protein